MNVCSSHILLRLQQVVIFACLTAGSSALSAHEDFSKFPQHDWPTYGGDFANTRFSQLEQIHRDNVDRLKVRWTFHTGLRGDPGVVWSSNPIVVDGVMYVTDPGPTGALMQTVIALNAKTGNELWRRTIILDSVPTNQFNIRSQRGVALGRGRVYFGALDAKLWALHAKSGEPVESFGEHGAVRIAFTSAGFYETMAPLFISNAQSPTAGRGRGRDLVVIGISGAENESRGFISAYDAITGELIWRFFTVPAPEEFGGDSWPALARPFADPFSRGGGSVWMTPSYDPELGYIFFGVGNAGPDFDGMHRAGANLFTVSIVAVDVATGQRAWHFQEVHHDLWDYDQAAPPVLFNIRGDGKRIPAVGAAGKTGWFYILNRKTGQPLIPCPERPVNTATSVVSPAPDGLHEHPHPTQPFCESDAFVPQGNRTLDGRFVSPIFTPPGLPNSKSGPFLFPFGTVVPISDVLGEPGNFGGSEWSPVSYNPDLGLAYISGIVLPVTFTSIPEANPTPGIGNLGGWWSFTANDVAKAHGLLTAMDVRTGKIRWQHRSDVILAGGSCATAGDVVFVGELKSNPGTRSCRSATSPRSMLVRASACSAIAFPATCLSMRLALPIWSVASNL